MRTRWFLSISAAFLFAFPLPGADRSVEPIVSRIQREPVQSSALTAVGYSKRLRALEVEFRDGLAYRYLKVSPATYRELMAAGSRTRYYNQHIRGKYHCLRVRPRRAR